MNHSIKWLFFSDHSLPDHSKTNIKHYPFTIEKFNRLASTKLNFKIEIKDPYKLCDFKPAYGKIFENYLTSFDYWGYSDIDLVFGKIDSFIDNELLENYDIINTNKNFMSGAFCLYKNSDYINSLFKKVQNFRQILQDPNHRGFDENLQPQLKSNSFGVRLTRFPKYLQYLFKQLVTKPIGLLHWKELRYQFQWYYKKKKRKKERQLKDMTEVIWYEKKHHKIKVWANNLVWSDKFLKRIGKNNWQIIWENGILYEKSFRNSIMAFHFLESKSNPYFKRAYSVNLNKIVITKKGFDVE